MPTYEIKMNYYYNITEQCTYHVQADSYDQASNKFYAIDDPVPYSTHEEYRCMDDVDQVSIEEIE